MIKSASSRRRPLPAAWRSAQHVHPEKSPSDLRLRPHPFGPLLVTFTSGIARSFIAHDRLGHRRVRSSRWLPRTRHPSSPRRRLGDGGRPADAEEQAHVHGCRTGGDGLHQVLTDLAPVWLPSTARPSGSASSASSSPRPRRSSRAHRRRLRRHRHLDRHAHRRGAPSSRVCRIGPSARTWQS